MSKYYFPYQPQDRDLFPYYLREGQWNINGIMWLVDKAHTNLGKLKIDDMPLHDRLGTVGLIQAGLGFLFMREMGFSNTDTEQHYELDDYYAALAALTPEHPAYKLLDQYLYSAFKLFESINRQYSPDTMIPEGAATVGLYCREQFANKHSALAAVGEILAQRNGVGDVVPTDLALLTEAAQGILKAQYDFNAAKIPGLADMGYDIPVISFVADDKSAPAAFKEVWTEEIRPSYITYNLAKFTGDADPAVTAVDFADATGHEGAHYINALVSQLYRRNAASMLPAGTSLSDNTVLWGTVMACNRIFAAPPISREHKYVTDPHLMALAGFCYVDHPDEVAAFGFGHSVRDVINGEVAPDHNLYMLRRSTAQRTAAVAFAERLRAGG